MTTPGNPIASLGDALNRYADSQEAMREHAKQLAPPETAPLAAGQQSGEDTTNALHS